MASRLPTVVPELRVPPASRGDYALNALREDLVSGRLLPGQRVTAEELALQLGVSHVPVREALRYLEAQGHFERDHRGRLRVSPTSPEEGEEVYLLRRLLESVVHERAVPLLTDEDILAVEREFDAMEFALAAGDIHSYARANRRFHFTVFERSGQPWMLRFLGMIWDAAARYQTALFVEDGWEGDLQAQHRKLLDAFRRRDATEVERLMNEHRVLAIEAARSRDRPSGAD
jgi:DNA-binding GntR family transcriptional regulator